MLILPESIIHILNCFAPFFSRRIWPWATVLLMGAVLAPGKRTVSAALRVMGLGDEVPFQNYHRVLSRARWSSQALSRRLLQLLVDTFLAPDARVVLGIDVSCVRSPSAAPETASRRGSGKSPSWARRGGAGV